MRRRRRKRGAARHDRPRRVDLRRPAARAGDALLHRQHRRQPRPNPDAPTHAELAGDIPGHDRLALHATGPPAADLAALDRLATAEARSAASTAEASTWRRRSKAMRSPRPPRLAPQRRRRPKRVTWRWPRRSAISESALATAEARATSEALLNQQATATADCAGDLRGHERRRARHRGGASDQRGAGGGGDDLRLRHAASRQRQSLDEQPREAAQAAALATEAAL